MVEIIIDYGSKNTRIAKRGEARIISEPTVAAVKYGNNNTYELLAYGTSVKKRFGELEAGEQIFCPVKQGVAVHEKVAAILLKAVMSPLLPAYKIFKPKVKMLAAVPSGLGTDERQKFEKMLLAAGVKQVEFVRSADAVAAVIPYKNFLLVDIGGSKTEVSLILNSKVCENANVTINLSGDAVNNALIDYMMDKHGIVIEKITAERLKFSVGSLYENDIRTANAGGMGIACKEPKNAVVSAGELAAVIQPLFDNLTDAINTVLSQIEDEEAGYAVYEAGIQLIGGGALLEGVQDYIERKTQMKAHLLKSPEHVIISGAVKLKEMQR
jgi:rod shape-determining protein MreB